MTSSVGGLLLKHRSLERNRFGKGDNFILRAETTKRWKRRSSASSMSIAATSRHLNSSATQETLYLAHPMAPTCFAPGTVWSHARPLSHDTFRIARANEHIYKYPREHVTHMFLSIHQLVNVVGRSSSNGICPTYLLFRSQYALSRYQDLTVNCSPGFSLEQQSTKHEPWRTHTAGSK
jgi:hypothetical protein